VYEEQYIPLVALPKMALSQMDFAKSQAAKQNHFVAVIMLAVLSVVPATSPCVFVSARISASASGMYI
jgi:hypothetical protein